MLGSQKTKSNIFLLFINKTLMSYKNTKPPDDYSGPERRKHIRNYGEDAIERLEQIVQNMPQFTPEEQALVRDVLEAYRGWQVLGKAMKLLVMFLASVSALVVAGGHIKDVLKAWLT